jgi:hypothetical protein
MKILIGAAYRKEIAGLENILNTLPEKYDWPESELIVTGQGIQNVYHDLQIKNLHNYTAVINVGTAGALSERFKPPMVLFPTTIIGKINGSLEIISTGNASRLGMEVKPAGWLTGNLYSSSIPMTAYADRQTIPNRIPVDAVDMEAFAYADLCRRGGVPFFVLKVISDCADGQTAIDFRSNLAVAADLLAVNVPLLIKMILKQPPEVGYD